MLKILSMWINYEHKNAIWKQLELIDSAPEKRTFVEMAVIRNTEEIW